MEGICGNVVNPVHFFQFRFSQSLHYMVGIELQMINPSLFFHILRDVAMATNLVAKMGQNYLPPPCTYRSAILKRNGISQPQYAR